MNERGKSYGSIVPAKPPNKAMAAEVVEGRDPAKGNTASKSRAGRRAGGSVSNELERVRQIAKGDRNARFTALLHHVTVERLEAAYRALRPQAAAGVDGVTWHTYGEGLEANLQDLHARVHRGAYRAKPSRRVYIPKADGRQRPLGIACRRRDTQRHLRGRLPRLLIWVPARTRTAPSAGRVGGRDLPQEGELGARLRSRRLLQPPRSWMAGEVRRAPRSGQEDPAPDPKVGEGRGHRGRGVDGK